MQIEQSPMNQASRCGAQTRSGKKCQSPPVRGKRRCRMHGGAAGSGAPIGNTNALRHGHYTAENLETLKAEPPSNLIVTWARGRAESHVKPRGRVRTELTESAELEVRIPSLPAKSQRRTDVRPLASRSARTSCSGGLRRRGRIKRPSKRKPRRGKPVFCRNEEFCTAPTGPCAAEHGACNRPRSHPTVVFKCAA
jgi:hypothetical protein